MAIWEKANRKETPQGVEITYKAEGTPLAIETRWESLPRVHGKGTINYPYYRVVLDGVEIKRFKLLSVAKKWASQVKLEFCLVDGPQHNYTDSYAEACDWMAMNNYEPDMYVRDEMTGYWFQIR